MRVAPTFLPVSRTSSGHLTSCTQPSFSTSQMPRAAMSIWPLNTPCLAQVGSAWCRLCHDSPNESTASHATFLDLSLASNSRTPKVWQIELIDQVTWCRNEIRTRLAHKKAISAPFHDVVGEPVGRELLVRGDIAVEQPAHVGPGHPLGQRLPVVTEPPGGVRVALL